MTEAQKDALRIVLNLASDNALDPDDYDEDHPDLHFEAVRQQEAITLIEQLWSKAVNG